MIQEANKTEAPPSAPDEAVNKTREVSAEDRDLSSEIRLIRDMDSVPIYHSGDFLHNLVRNRDDILQVHYGRYIADGAHWVCTYKLDGILYDITVKPVRIIRQWKDDDGTEVRYTFCLPCRKRTVQHRVLSVPEDDNSKLVWDCSECSREVENE